MVASVFAREASEVRQEIGPTFGRLRQLPQSDRESDDKLRENRSRYADGPDAFAAIEKRFLLLSVDSESSTRSNPARVTTLTDHPK
jgi:hypothetical protein